MSDTIYRQDVIDALDITPFEDYGDYKTAVGVVKDVPSVECRHGEWIKMDKRGNNVQCSKCGNTLDLRGVNAGRGDANYCPNCGADMRLGRR